MSNPTPPETRVSLETRLIPLRLLRQDDANVRGAASDPASAQADAELVASIRAHGLLENLVVTPRTKTLFGVAAGSRRLAALQELAKAGDIPKNHPVPCLVIEPDAAAESSLAENAIRVAMHPADQVRAFRRLADDGASAEQIAARFGMAERTVQKRLRLGGLADEILDAYRAGELKFETAQAFAITADAEFQRAVYQSLRERGRLYAHDVRHALGQRLQRSDSPAACFVGLDAYVEAGGALEDRLFDDDCLTILDPDLLAKLARTRLEAEAARYAGDWKWTAVQFEFGWSDEQQYLVAGADERAEFIAEETKELAVAEATIEAASEALDDPSTDADRRRELWATVHREQNRYAQIERDRGDRDTYPDAARAHGGVIVALDREGDLDIHRGLIRADDADAYRAASAAASQPAPTQGSNGHVATPAPDGNGSVASPGNGATPVPGAPDAAGGTDDDVATGKKNGGYSDALRQDLRIMRTAAVRRALSHDADVAADLIGFVLARMTGFGRREPRYEPAILSISKQYQPLYPSEAMNGSGIMQHLEPAPQDINLGWLGDEDAGAAFRAYRQLGDAERASVLAHAVAALTVPHLANDHDVSGAFEQAVSDLGMDLPAELAAVGAMPFDADILWKRMTKGMILDAAAETIGSEWARNRGALKKTELVATAANAFRPDPAREPDRDAAASRWMPPGFEPAGVATARRAAAERSAPAAGDDEAPAETDAGATDIPAFLTQ